MHETQPVRKLSEQVLNAFKSTKEFDCIRCGKHVVVVEKMIFYNLCDECFGLFDNQKMVGRLLQAKFFNAEQTARLSAQYPRTFENPEDWMAYEKEQT